jgi:hypothetical protein
MFGFSMEMDGLMRTLAECQRRNLDMGPPLKQFGREKRKEIAAIIAAGRGFPPLAPSTLAKYEQRDRQHAKFTQTGGIRKSYQQRLEREKARNEGLRKWAMETYGRIPSRLTAKFQRFDERMAKLQAESEKRRQNMLFDASQVSTRERFAGQQLVEVRVMREGKRKLARIASPGFSPAATVRLPTHLNKPGAVYQIPASALQASSPTRFTVGAGSIMRMQKPEKPATSSSGGKVHKMLGRVPSTLFYKVLNKGAAFALIIGSKWTKDGIQNQGDGHVPKREHIKLEREDIQRIKQICVDYGIEPLRGGQ